VRYGIPDRQRADTLAAKLEPMVTARARFHQQRYGTADEERAPDLGQTPGHGIEFLRDFIERHLGAEALHPTWQRYRQRRRITGYEQQRGRGRGGDDRPGAAITRPLAAFGATLQGARQRHDAALADLDRASGRLELASGAISASAGAVDPWEWLRYWFYGLNVKAAHFEFEVETEDSEFNVEREHGYGDWEIER
jgi:hypothetical protein